MPAVRSPRAPERRTPQSTSSYLALTQPGVGRIVEQELAADKVGRVVRHGNDGRSDVVIFNSSLEAGEIAGHLHAAEDLLMQVGHAQVETQDRAPWLARRLLNRRRLLDAVDAHRDLRGKRTRNYRVVVRVRSERLFMRTELRRATAKVLEGLLPGWRPSESPDAAELWVLEYRNRQFAAGIRLTDKSFRQRGGRQVERKGALRPAVARAMVELAGPPSGFLLDPFCGSGSILGAAREMGWKAVGSDLASDAVTAAGRNAPSIPLLRADSARLPVRADALGSLVSNLPFGKQYEMPSDQKRWLATLLGEFERVLKPDGKAVLLTGQPIAALLRPAHLELVTTRPIRILGQSSVITACTKPR